MTKAFEKALEREIVIANVQKYNMYDGPGIRTIIFFKGCPLRCKWCSNPETFEQRPKVFVKESLCINCGKCVEACPQHVHAMVDGKHKIYHEKMCLGIRNCERVCPVAAISVAGEIKKVGELLDIVEEDRIFYENSGGGVTISGGEPLLQHNGAADLLMACKHEGFNTAIETSGYAPREHLLQVAQYVDLFLFDIKLIDDIQHEHYTGVRNHQILDNFKILMELGYNARVRMPLLKDINTAVDYIERTVEFLKPYKDLPNFKGVDLLPYHKFGVNKYRQMGFEYPLEHVDPSVDEGTLATIGRLFKDGGIKVNIVHH